MIAFIAGGAMRNSRSAPYRPLSRRTDLTIPRWARSPPATPCLATAKAPNRHRHLLSLRRLRHPIYSLSVAHPTPPEPYEFESCGRPLPRLRHRRQGRPTSAPHGRTLRPHALFYYTSAVHGVFLAFTAYRINRRHADRRPRRLVASSEPPRNLQARSQAEE
jgi:hypothetical protein